MLKHRLRVANGSFRAVMSVGSLRVVMLTLLAKLESPQHVDAKKIRGLTLQHASSGQSDALVWDSTRPVYHI